MKHGRVQRKNRTARFVKEYPAREPSQPVPIVFEPAARGCRHVVSEAELRAFVALIPDWHAHERGLRCLVLGDGDDDCYGWHDSVICIHAWSAFVVEWGADVLAEHRAVLDLLMVPYDEGGAVRFTRESARAFQLLHVFLHELGHHCDRMATRNQTHSPRGEAYAESFALAIGERIWPAFARAFGV